ncbi:MAG: prepilin-type N-terminal cleavage/methylation domain-containing protein [Erysipelotrichaceae bacterium]|nr:prepilin-type N-terminal cleavage/methylation domain-containing protein [Erysipelotrichaceae bacterium]
MKKDINSKGFTLAELLIVIAIIAILVAIMFPVFSGGIEKSREAKDAANVRSAYGELMATVVMEDKTAAYNGTTIYNNGVYSVTVKLDQKVDDWQGNVSNIGGVNKGDDNWIGIPVSGGTCTVSYDSTNGLIIRWSGTGNSANIKPTYSTKTAWTYDNSDGKGAIGKTLSQVQADKGWPSMVTAVNKLLTAKDVGPGDTIRIAGSETYVNFKLGFFIVDSDMTIKYDSGAISVGYNAKDYVLPTDLPEGYQVAIQIIGKTTGIAPTIEQAEAIYNLISIVKN